DNKTADPAALRSAHEAFVAADNKVRDLEEKAVLADPKVNELRQRVDAAQEPLVQMRDKFEQDLEKEPSFAAVLDDMQQQQKALDAALADQTKLDTQIAALQDGGGAAGSTGGYGANSDSLRASIRDGERNLDVITADLRRAQDDVARLEGRLRDDGDSSYAARDRGVAGDSGRYPIEEERVVERTTVIEQPTYVETSVVEVPYYS